MAIEDDDRWCTICGKDPDRCTCEIGPSLNDPDAIEPFDPNDDEEL